MQLLLMLILLIFNSKNDLKNDAGITPDTRHDDQHELVVKPDQSDNQSAIKQSLITSYRKNIYPSSKEDLNQSYKHSGGRSPSRSMRKLNIFSFRI